MVDILKVRDKTTLQARLSIPNFLTVWEVSLRIGCATLHAE